MWVIYHSPLQTLLLKVDNQQQVITDDLQIPCAICKDNFDQGKLELVTTSNIWKHFQKNSEYP